MVGIIILYAVIAVILHAYMMYPYNKGYVNQYNVNAYRSSLVLMWGALLFNIITTGAMGWNLTPQSPLEWLFDIITVLFFVAGNTLFKEITDHN